MHLWKFQEHWVNLTGCNRYTFYYNNNSYFFKFSREKLFLINVFFWFGNIIVDNINVFIRSFKYFLGALSCTNFVNRNNNFWTKNCLVNIQKVQSWFWTLLNLYIQCIELTRLGWKYWKIEGLIGGDEDEKDCLKGMRIWRMDWRELGWEGWIEGDEDEKNGLEGMRMRRMDWRGWGWEGWIGGDEDEKDWLKGMRIRRMN